MSKLPILKFYTFCPTCKANSHFKIPKTGSVKIQSIYLILQLNFDGDDISYPLWWKDQIMGLVEHTSNL